jgi:integrase
MTFSAGAEAISVTWRRRCAVTGADDSFVMPDPGALAFPGAKGGPLRRGNFNRSAAWPQAVAAIGVHFHDLRHAGNTFAASSGAGLRDCLVTHR